MPWMPDLYALDEVLELRADEGGAGVGRVHVQPDGLLLADQSEFLQVVEGADGCGAQCRGNVERNQPHLTVFLRVKSDTKSTN